MASPPSALNEALLSPRLSGTSDPTARAEARARLLSPKVKALGPLSEEYTFRPRISARSRQLNSATAKEELGPRWLALSRQDAAAAKRAKEVEEAAKAEKEEEEKNCTFRPTISQTSHRIC